MLTEDDVVLAVCADLERAGWRIVSRALATQHGDDIVAERDGQRLIIEAKGGGSSKSHTARYGKEFTASQHFTAVAKASLRAMRVASANDSTQAAVALPDTANYRRVVEPVMPSLRTLGITVYLVRPDLAVGTL